MSPEIKSLLSDHPELLHIIGKAERREIQVVAVCQSVGFHDDPEMHRRVVEYLASVGCTTHLAPDGEPDRGLAGIRG